MRGRPTFGDMVRTAVIFGVLIVALFLLVPRSHQRQVAQPVDYSGDLQLVSHRAPFHVFSPQGLDAAWIPTHVNIAVPQNGTKISTLDLGFYVQKPSAYAQLEQSDAPGWLTTQLGKTAKQTGTATVRTDTGPIVYQTWTDSAGQPALVRATADGSTLVLNGKAPVSVLTTLAGSLR